MTKAELTPLYNGCIFECAGHAGYAPEGTDIVCAGISALCMALINSLEQLQDEADISIERVHFADGEFCVEVSYAENCFSRERARTVFSTVMQGLKAIERLYPDYLFVN